ncbi:MAG: ABC transporter permease [Oscillospiraceae bacterium]|nr:ABC transporter permease [Oscillospiraceae bacterium]
MSTVYFLVQQTMYFSIPLLVVALGGLFAERSGIINIALEGIMIMGAFSGVLFMNRVQFAGEALSGQLLLFLALIVSGVAGGLIALPHAYASINMKANQIISGTAINMFTPAVTMFIARAIFGVKQIPFKNYFLIEKVALLGEIPVIGPLFFRNTYITTYIGFIILILSWLLLYKTPFGLRIRSCGEHPHAADSAGINVYRMRYAGTLISGILAGVGGLIFVVPTSVQFDGTVSGYGFLALAVLIFGQWKPTRILAAAFFFGLIKTIAATSSGLAFLSGLPIPSDIYKMIPYITTIVVLAFSSRASMAPRAEGIPYDKGGR